MAEAPRRPSMADLLSQGVAQQRLKRADRAPTALQARMMALEWRHAHLHSSEYPLEVSYCTWVTSVPSSFDGRLDCEIIVRS